MGATGSAAVSDVHLVLERNEREEDERHAVRVPYEKARDGPDVGASPHAPERAASGPQPISLTPAEHARLKAIMTAHFNFIWRSLQRLGVPPGDVDDCAQQVFLVASRRLPTITEGSEQSFLFGTALNVAAEARRTAARRRDSVVDGPIEAFDPGPQPDEIADRTRVRALLDKVLEAMPMDLRVTFVLFELEEMPLQQIASLLSIPTGTVASRLRRARVEFQRLVARLNASGTLRGVRR
jgi:RNA polymerase sigma-70 factor (ECF subfamily)